MHERLWIDTGPLISPHRQLLCSGVEPTPMAATAAAQITGLSSRETWEGTESRRRRVRRRPRRLWETLRRPPNKTFMQSVSLPARFLQTLKSACKTGARWSRGLKNTRRKKKKRRSHLWCAESLFSHRGHYYSFCCPGLFFSSSSLVNKNSKHSAVAATRYIKHTAVEDIFTFFT